MAQPATSRACPSFHPGDGAGKQGRATKAGAEVRIYREGTQEILGTRIMDTRSGYCSQNIIPMHFELAGEMKVDVEVTSMTKTGRTKTRFAEIDGNELPRRVLTVKVA
jgi:hypothetical protein